MSFATFRARYLVRFWAPIPALLALGVASAYYFAITGTFWAVTGEFTRWGGHMAAWMGFAPQQWSYFQLIGLNGTPMISYAQTLTEQQRWQIIAYVMSKRIEGPPLLNPSSTTQASK